MAGSSENLSYFSQEQIPNYEFVDGRIDQWDVDPNTKFKPLRIVVMGKGQFADEYLKGSLLAGHEVVGVFGPAKLEGKDLDVVRATAKEHGIPNFKFSSLNEESTRKLLKEELKPDIIIGASLTADIPREVPETALMGMWGWHPSILPEYRGGSAINWQIVNGQEEIGMTCYAIGREDEQIISTKPINRATPLPEGTLENDPNDKYDKGPILSQAKVKREPGASTASAVFPKKLMPEGVKFMIETTNKMAIAKDMGLIFRGEPQVDGEGSYQPPMEKHHAKIDLTLPAKKAHDKAEGGSFNPGGHITDENGNMVTVYETGVVEGATEKPGRLAKVVELEEGKGYVLIETGENLLRADTLRTGIMEGKREKKGKPTPAHILARELNWQEGVTILK